MIMILQTTANVMVMVALLLLAMIKKTSRYQISINGLNCSFKVEKNDVLIPL